MGDQETESSRSADAWDTFLESSRRDIGYKQSSWWSEFSASRGWRQFGVAVSEEKVIVGGARVLVQSFKPGKCFYYVPHGPVLPQHNEDAGQIFEAVLAHIDQTRKEETDVVSHLRLEPRWEDLPGFVRGCQPARNWLEPRRTLCVDLRPTEESILKQMKPKGRYNIRVASRHGVSVVEDSSPQGVEDFFEIYNATVTRHNIRKHSKQYFHSLTERLFPLDRGAIFFAEQNGVRLAAALLVFHGNTATYKYGGSRPAQRNLMAPYLLHFEAMRMAKKRGHHWYDFYGVSPPDRPNDRWAAISVFKRKFGGREFTFVPAMDFVYDPDAYEDYHESRKKAGT